MQIMTQERAEQIRAEYAKATHKWGGELFQHFHTEEEKQAHLDEVRALQESGQVAF